MKNTPRLALVFFPIPRRCPQIGTVHASTEKQMTNDRVNILNVYADRHKLTTATSAAILTTLAGPTPTSPHEALFWGMMKPKLIETHLHLESHSLGTATPLHPSKQTSVL